MATEPISSLVPELNGSHVSSAERVSLSGLLLSVKRDRLLLCVDGRKLRY